MTDETKQENPETTAPEQASTETAPPAALDDGASSMSDGGLTLDDSEPEIPSPAETAAEKPADDIPETSLSLEMDEPEPAPPAPAEDAPVAETAAPAEPVAEAPVTEAPVMEPPAIEDTAAAPVFDDAETQPEATPPAEEPVMTSPVQEEPSFAENPAPEAPVEPVAEAPAMEAPAAEAPPLPPVAEAPQTGFDENAGGNFDEFPGDEVAAFDG
ncbi:MAG: hypothetical protein EP349_02545, partial [Alphaproteobacteria bacterium]